MKCTHKMDRPCRTHSWKVSWQMLLLAASILSSCFLLTRGQERIGISIRVVPEVLKEGDSVTLTPEGLDLKKLSNCKWYRGAIEERNLIITVYSVVVEEVAVSLQSGALVRQDQGRLRAEEQDYRLEDGRGSKGVFPGKRAWCRLKILGPSVSHTGEPQVPVRAPNITFFLIPVFGQANGTAHTGRETGNKDCSLQITDLKPDDSGTYSFKPEALGVSNTGATNITVSEILSHPVLWPTESLGSGNTSVTLYCNTSDRLDVSILWFKDGNPVQSKTGLSDRNRTLTLTSITKEDEGIYTCQAVNPVSNAISNPSKITLAYSSGGSSPSSGSAGALAGTVIESLAVILVLVGTLTYVSLRVCRRNGKTSTQVVSTPQIYENVPPPGQVHHENSSSAANTYETLQPRIPSVYEEIQR
ncbi:carcinoembryonic antigen-related cell adhesion molecule 1-like [Zootoca vivipara]|uniref:carcinoembryonic antigen-related cell adhesion molecule 1-like n=1 Tax=Zootoca vivipara TaxID=8524 RepID=UPI00293C04D8|nr:carcinoembryonic antigen-related cell adhesion molecule 1-like [Zootoca vivipara]